MVGAGVVRDRTPRVRRLGGRLDRTHETERSAHVLSHTFHLDASAREARLYATAHGIYETFLNGRRVGDVELTPGFTSYPDHAACAGLRRDRPPRRRRQPLGGRALRRLVARAAPASSRASTATAPPSASSASSRPTADVVTTGGLGVGDRAPLSRRPHGGPSRGPPAAAGGLAARRGIRRRPSARWPARPAPRPAACRSCGPSR